MALNYIVLTVSEVFYDCTITTGEGPVCMNI